VLTYLFDASAAVAIYVKERIRVDRAVRYILDQKTVHSRAAIYIPNFCIPEVFNTLARKHFREAILDRPTYDSCLQRFRDDIHWGRTLYSYELNRYHIIAADEIIPIEHHLAPEFERDHLSTFDILIIAMACELAFVGEAEDTFLVTCDKRIEKVVQEMKAIRADELKEWKTPGNLDDPGTRRWVPPTDVLYLHKAKLEIRQVPGQPPLNC